MFLKLLRIRLGAEKRKCAREGGKREGGDITKQRTSANKRRSSPLDEVIRDALDRVSRCALILSRDGGGMVRSWTCTLLWSERADKNRSGKERFCEHLRMCQSENMFASTHEIFGDLNNLQAIINTTDGNQGNSASEQGVDKNKDMRQMRRCLCPCICTKIFISTLATIYVSLP